MSSRAAGVAPSRTASAALCAGPALLLAGLVIGMEPALIGRLVPIETASIQGLIALPMLLVAPAILSLAWMDPATARRRAWVAVGCAIAIAFGVISWVAGNVGQIGCQPVINPIQTLPVGSIWGAVAAAGFFLATRAGSKYARAGRLRAALVAGAGVGVLAFAADITAFVLLFPPLSCTPPRGLI